jgi:hypothetical protein
MNRQLEVYLNKSLAATVHFNYEKETEGTAECTTYMLPYDDEEPSYKPSPMHTESRTFRHGAFPSIEEIKKFDIDFFNKEFSHWVTRYKPELAVMIYAAEDIIYRYLIYYRRDEPIGIATIRTNFLSNTKEMDFLSTKDIRFDQKLTSDSLESNAGVFKRLFKDYLAPFSGEEDDFFYSFKEACRWFY